MLNKANGQIKFIYLCSILWKGELDRISLEIDGEDGTMMTQIVMIFPCTISPLQMLATFYHKYATEAIFLKILLSPTTETDAALLLHHIR